MVLRLCVICGKYCIQSKNKFYKELGLCSDCNKYGKKRISLYLKNKSKVDELIDKTIKTL